MVAGVFMQDDFYGLWMFLWVDEVVGESEVGYLDDAIVFLG